MSERPARTPGRVFARAFRWWLGVPERHPVEAPPKSLAESHGPDVADATPPETAAIHTQLDAIQGRLDGLAERLSVRADTGRSSLGDPELRSALAGIEKQLARIGREQLRANALLEAQAERLDAVLEAAHASVGLDESGPGRPGAHPQAAEAAARLDLVRDTLPALDGLDEALRAGEELLERFGESAPPREEGSGLWRWRRKPERPQERDALREAVRGWLEGLTYVRQRLLDAIASAGVQPIQARGESFDPGYHAAVEVVPARDDLPPGTVASELRRGYLVDGRVLRHAEVAVSRDGGAAGAR